MQSGTCPKCQNANVVMRRDGLRGENWVVFNLGIVAGAVCAVYVCTDCGYSETYMANPEDRRSLLENKHWERVRPS